MKPKLFIMCGLSGSGKSSIAKDLAVKYHAEIVSSDAIREELFGSCQNQSDNEKVFNIFNKRIRESLNKNKNVIADATNITIKSRRAIVEYVRKLDVEKICYIVPNPDKPEKLFLFSTPCVILKKKGVFICYSLINTLIKFMASLPVMTA